MSSNSLIVNFDSELKPETGNDTVDTAIQHFLKSKPLHSLECSICKFVNDLLHWLHVGFGKVEATLSEA